MSMKIPLEAQSETAQVLSDSLKTRTEAKKNWAWAWKWDQLVGNLGERHDWSAWLSILAAGTSLIGWIVIFSRWNH